MKFLIKKILGNDANESERNRWLGKTLANIPAGLRVLDAGAGELRNKGLCAHLSYVSQDFCQYDGGGDGCGYLGGDNGNGGEGGGTSGNGGDGGGGAVPAWRPGWEEALAAQARRQCVDDFRAMAGHRRVAVDGGL